MVVLTDKNEIFLKKVSLIKNGTTSMPHLQIVTNEKERKLFIYEEGKRYRVYIHAICQDPNSTKKTIIKQVIYQTDEFNTLT